MTLLHSTVNSYRIKHRYFFVQIWCIFKRSSVHLLKIWCIFCVLVATDVVVVVVYAHAFVQLQLEWPRNLSDNVTRWPPKWHVHAFQNSPTLSESKYISLVRLVSPRSSLSFPDAHALLFLRYATRTHARSLKSRSYKWVSLNAVHCLSSSVMFGAGDERGLTTAHNQHRPQIVISYNCRHAAVKNYSLKLEERD